MPPLRAAMTSAGSIAFMSQSGALCTAILDYALAEQHRLFALCQPGQQGRCGRSGPLRGLARRPAHQGDHRLHRGRSKMAPEFMRQAARRRPATSPSSPSSRAARPPAPRPSPRTRAAWPVPMPPMTRPFCSPACIRADSVQELFDYSTAFAYQPLLKGNRIAIVTNAGGPGVMATDALGASTTCVLADAAARDRRGARQDAARRGQHP